MQNICSSVLCYIRKKIQKEMSLCSLHIMCFSITFYCFQLSSTYIIFPSSFPSSNPSHLPKHKHHLFTHLLKIRPLYLNYYWYMHTYTHTHTQPNECYFLLWVYGFRTYYSALNNKSQCHSSLGESNFPYSHIH